jgi:hypothetical protein
MKMKPKTDPVIDELHAVRRQIAQRFDYDIRKISADAKRRQEEEGRPIWRPKPAESGAKPAT